MGSNFDFFVLFRSFWYFLGSSGEVVLLDISGIYLWYSGEALGELWGSSRGGLRREKEKK